MKGYKASSRLVRCSSNYIPSNQLENMPPTDYISRDEVIRIIIDCDNRNMDYWVALKYIKRIHTLPDKSIQIREMIEKKLSFDPQDEFSCWYKKMWEELLSEIDSL
jgi:hypothetical protein